VKHTKAPWIPDESFPDDLYRYVLAPKAVTESNPTGIVCRLPVTPKAEADARLIAAAPELYAAGHALLTCVPGLDDWLKAVERMEAALRAVEGRREI
jgi:hypothetical protein